MTAVSLSQPDNFDAVIIGGGMVGLSLAVALARAHLRVAVVEQSALKAQLDPAFDGRVSAIAYGSRCLLERLGAWSLMAEQGEPIRDIRVSNGNTPFFLHYDHREVGDAPFGYIVENRYIRHALQQVAQELPSLRIYDNASLDTSERDDIGVTVRLKDGRLLRASMLVGADGKRSRVRLEAGIGALEWQYRQTAIVCTIGHSQPHDGLAQERFLPAGPFAVLPMKSHNGIHRSSLVWVEPEERVQSYLQLPDGELIQEITERVGDYLGDISLLGPRFTYPLGLMHAKTYISHRLALIGDAAHSIHPIAGQGVNLGFRDVAVLSELIIDRFRLGLAIGAADMLAHYQRWRRFDNVAMLATTDGLNRLFSNHSMPLSLARGIGLWAVGKLPPVKRFFMRDAMGLTGDLPKIIKENL